jgi:hypothetical protein
MNVQTALSSPRTNRILLWFSALVLAAGVLLVVTRIAGGSDKSARGPDKGFTPSLPQKQVQLKNSQGVPIRKFDQLDEATRETIRTFLATAVAREHLDRSWAVIHPSLKKGYTHQQWSHANALPIVPYPHADVNTAQYYLDYASTKEILIEVGLSVRPEIKGEARTRPTAFQLGLTPVGKGAQQRWLVDYWMPRWTPPIPIN